MADPHAAVAAVVLNYASLSESIAALHHVDPALVLAIIHDESGGNPDAFPEDPARDGASFGLMQLLLPTARSVGFTGAARFLFDPPINVHLGTAYLASLIAEHTNPWLALVAYNGGPRAVAFWSAGWRFGPAVHYANVVWALRAYYERRLSDLRARAAADT